MDKLDLTQRHPLHRANLARWRFLRDHYQGGLAYLSRGYLSRHERESERNFRRRLQDSRYPNFCKPIVHLFVSHLWRRKPRRGLPEPLAGLTSDVDRFGSGINAFMRQVTTAAGVEGHAFVLVDAPAGLDPATRAEELAWNLRPYFVCLSPQQVLDWEFELNDPLAFGRLNRVVLAEPDERGGPPHYRVWTPAAWALFHSRQPHEAPVKAAEGENPLGVIPLVCVYNLKAGQFLGESTIEDIAPLNHALYQKTSILDEAEYWAGFPQLVIFTDEEVAEVELSQSRALQFRPGDEARFIEHSGVAIESLRSTVGEIKQDIFRIAVKQIGEYKATAGVESAAKKRLDRAEFVASLEERAVNFEEAEKALWRLAAAWVGAGAEPIEIEYNRRFDLESLSEALGRLFVELGDKGYLDKPAVVKELVRHGLVSEEAAEQERLV